MQSYENLFDYARYDEIVAIVQSQQASAKLQKVFKKLYFWRRKV